MKFSADGIESDSDLKDKIGYREMNHKIPLTYNQSIDYMIDDCLEKAQYNLGCIVYLLEREKKRNRYGYGKRTYGTDSFSPFIAELDIFLELVKEGFFTNLKENT